ncbi:Superkiller protein 3, partial [Ascosphaera atra]
MSTKAALKSIRGLLDSDPAQAAEEAKELLQRESQNYNAHVFLGFALDKLGQFDAAEASYNRAVAIKSNDYAAWQGLVSSYQKQGDAKLDGYDAVVRKLCDLFLE